LLSASWAAGGRRSRKSALESGDAPMPSDVGRHQ
jgi:hypothetical protein